MENYFKKKKRSYSSFDSSWETCINFAYNLSTSKKKKKNTLLIITICGVSRNQMLRGKTWKGFSYGQKLCWEKQNWPKSLLIYNSHIYMSRVFFFFPSLEFCQLWFCWISTLLTEESPAIKWEEMYNIYLLVLIKP